MDKVFCVLLFVLPAVLGNRIGVFEYGVRREVENPKTDGYNRETDVDVLQNDVGYEETDIDPTDAGDDEVETEVELTEAGGDDVETGLACSGDDKEKDESNEEYLQRCRCPRTFSRYGDWCFHGSAITANWMYATVFCEAYGARLIIIDTAYKQKLVKQFIQTEYQKASYWIAATDVLWNNRWVWYGGQKMTYSDWYSGYPSTTSSYKCAYIYRSYNLKWLNYTCTSSYNFICERRARK